MLSRVALGGLPVLVVLAAACDGGAPPAGAQPASSSAAAAVSAAPDAGPDAEPASAPADAGADADAGDAGADADAGDVGDAGDGGAAAEPSCPDDMVHPGRYYCVDRFEDHLVIVGPDGSITPHPYYEVPETDVTYWARSEKDVYPQAYISRTVAQAACKAAGKRLCTREEWMRACRNPKG